MGRKLWLWLLVLLVLYVIIQDPDEAGRTASNFFAWLGDGFAAFFDFLGSMFDGDGGGGELESLGRRVAAATA